MHAGAPCCKVLCLPLMGGSPLVATTGPLHASPTTTLLRCQQSQHLHAPTGRDDEEGGAPKEAPAPREVATVLWLDVRAPKGGESTVATLPRGDLIRPQAPLSRPILQRWLRDVASAEAVAGVKGVPCVWRAKAELCELYGLPTALPKMLVRALSLHYCNTHLALLTPLFRSLVFTSFQPSAW